MDATAVKQPAEPQVWSIDSWSRDMGISRGMFHKIPKEKRPNSTRIGKLVRIFESPRDYARRVAALGGVSTKSAA